MFHRGFGVFELRHFVLHPPVIEVETINQQSQSGPDGQHIKFKNGIECHRNHNQDNQTDNDADDGDAVVPLGLATLHIRCPSVESGTPHAHPGDLAQEAGDGHESHPGQRCHPHTAVYCQRHRERNDHERQNRSRTPSAHPRHGNLMDRQVVTAQIR